VRTAKGYAFYEGPRRVYGPWASKADRDAAAAALANRLGRTVRRYSQAVAKAPGIIAPDALGKTT
jgi:hypothetical protein